MQVHDTQQISNTLQIAYVDGGVIYTHANGNTLTITGEQDDGEVFKNNTFYAYYAVNKCVLTYEDEDGNVLHTLADAHDEAAYNALAEQILA